MKRYEWTGPARMVPGYGEVQKGDDVEAIPPDLLNGYVVVGLVTVVNAEVLKDSIKVTEGGGK